MNISKHISSRAFWDADYSNLDFTINRKFVITRVFDYGKWSDIIKVIAIYGDRKVIKTLKETEHLTELGLHIASTIFKINKKDF